MYYNGMLVFQSIENLPDLMQKCCLERTPHTTPPKMRFTISFTIHKRPESFSTIDYCSLSIIINLLSSDGIKNWLQQQILFLRISHQGL